MKLFEDHSINLDRAELLSLSILCKLEQGGGVDKTGFKTLTRVCYFSGTRVIIELHLFVVGTHV